MVIIRAKRIEAYRPRTYLYHADDGYHYHRNRTFPNGRVALRCVRYKSNRCLGRAVMDGDRSNFVETNGHNHDRDLTFVPVRTLRRQILNRCRTNDMTPPHEIVQQEGIHYPRRVRAKVMPNNLRSSMRRAHLSNFPNIPRNLTSLARVLRDPVNRHLSTSLDAEDFIYGGSCGKATQRTRSVIFISRRFKEILTIIRKVHGDGTWDARPAVPETSQCFVIVTTIDHQMIPLMIVLMERKSESAYDTLFAKIKNICPDFRPTRVVTDFESAQINSWIRAYPGIVVQACYFHCVKAMCMYARQLGLTELIKNNEMVATIVRSCCAIPLLPPNQIRNGLACLVQLTLAQGLSEELADFLDYVYKEWIVKKGHVLSVNGSEDRTNNSCESFHFQFQGLLGRRKPSIWRFLEGIKKSEDMAFQDLYVIVHGGNVRRSRKTSSVSNDINIANLSNRLQEGLIDLPTFLRRASRRVANVFAEIFPA